MEEELTLEELYALIEGMQRTEHRHNRFAAAIQGVDLEKDSKQDDAFEQIRLKAAAELAGKDEDEFVLNMIGIEFEDDEDDQPILCRQRHVELAMKPSR